MPTPLSTSRPEQPVAVWLGATFATLVQRTDVYARAVNRAASPAADSAELISDYGRIARPGEPWAIVAPIALRDQCCEVRTQVAGTWSTLFQGLVTTDVIQPDGTYELLGAVQVPNGQVRHTCRGLDWLLERTTPHQSVTAAYSAVGEVFAFNGTGTPPERNCSAAKTTDASGTSRVFAWGSGCGLWSSQNIIEYILRFATAQTGYTWVLAGASSALEAVTPQVDPRGKNLRQILAECIRPQDGYAWRTSVSGTTATITVFSLTDTPVLDLDGATAIPANADTFSLAASLDTDRDITAPVVTPVAESAYKYVDLVSEPIRVIAMLGRESTPGAADGFEPAWTAGQEIVFVSATDKVRAEDVMRDVYSAWRLPADWDGKDWAGNNLIPSWDATAGTFSFATAGTLATPALLFERRLPYSDGGDRESDESDALLLLWDGSTWVQPERDSGKKKCAVGLKLSDSGPTIRLHTAHPSQLATAGWGGSSQYTPDWDPKTDGFLVTLSFYTHTLLTLRTTAATGSGTKRIYVPGYHLWVCPAAATWSPGNAIAANTILRDDRPAMKRLAAQLSHWYGRTRNTLRYSSAQAPGPVNIGRIVSSLVTTGGAITLIGTPVTSETWNWDDRGTFTYSLGTDFADLDILALSRRKVENTERETSRRLRRIEERVQSLPLRQPLGGSSDTALIKITGLHSDSPTAPGTTPMFLGSIYANGLAAAATETGVTVALDGATQNTPAYTRWQYVPAVNGIPVAMTWTGATATHTADRVYYVSGLMILCGDA